jgi:hypothetical protein
MKNTILLLLLAVLFISCNQGVGRYQYVDKYTIFDTQTGTIYTVSKEEDWYYYTRDLYRLKPYNVKDILETKERNIYSSGR